MSVGNVIAPRSHGHAATRFRFLRHLLEMTLAMMVGMVASAAVFLTAVGLTVDEGLRQYPVQFVLVQAFGMTVAMVVWMRHRGHAWGTCSEMAAAMVVPAIPLVGLRLAHVINGSVCGLYCAASFLAMVLVMFYRRGEYSAPSAVAPHPE